LFVVDNLDLHHTLSQIHDINTRHNFDLYQPHSNLTSYQNGPSILVLSFLTSFLIF